MTIRITHTIDETAGEIKSYDTFEIEFGPDTPPDMVKFIIREVLLEKPEVTYSLDQTFNLDGIDGVAFNG